MLAHFLSPGTSAVGFVPICGGSAGVIFPFLPFIRKALGIGTAVTGSMAGKSRPLVARELNWTVGGGTSS
jgi:hypothetical protein